jgi:hypothetical protein
MLAAAVISATAQEEPTSTSPPAGEGPKPAYTQVDPGKSLDFLGEAVNRSNLDLGMGILAAYDTNIAAFGPQAFPQMSYLISPHIGVSQYRPKLGMAFSYDGGLGIYTRLSHSDTYSQSATGDILYQLSPHWQLHAKDNYSYSADPFGSYFTIAGQPTPNYPNPITYIPFATTSQNVAEADVAYQITKYDTLTFSGTESFRRYNNYSGSYTFQTGLYNMISYVGSANYNHRVSPKLSLGGGYSFQSLDFSHGQQKSGISTIQFFASYQINRSWSISGWAGPEYITAKTYFFPFGPQFPQYYVLLLQNDWAGAGGVNIGYQGLRDSFTIGGSKQVSDGGGLLATTVVYSANAAYRRKLAARWDGTASGQYGRNISFAASNLDRRFFPDRSYTLLTIYLQLNREITPHLNAMLQYGFTHEYQQNIYLTGTPNYNDNRVAVSLQYTWNHPLGR